MLSIYIQNNLIQLSFTPSLREERDDCDIVAIRVSFKKSKNYFHEIIELIFNMDILVAIQNRNLVIVIL